MRHFALVVIFIALLAFGSLVPAEETAQSCSIDFGQSIGKIKPVNGVNLWARMSTASFDDKQNQMIQANFSTVRLHDAPWDNPGMRLVDIQHIFGNRNADPADPDNYYFKPTDDYIQRIREGGPDVIYRLGTSIEHSAPNFYFAKEPKDYKKFAAVCAGIIRHYNQKWADGFDWNIKYWEIWNEPNVVPQMWNTKDFSVYCKFYVEVAKALKKEFPTVKFGGPALGGNDPKLIKQFVETCRAEDAPIDFLSWHGYCKAAHELTDSTFVFRKILDENGYTATELHLNEWHYFPCKWSEIHGLEGGAQRRAELRNGPDGLNGIDAAAFIALVLTRWQDTPLTMANYYAASLTGETDWSLFDDYGVPFKTYFAFKMFGELLKNAPNRVATVDGKKSISILAGTGPNGRKMALVAGFKTDLNDLHIKLIGLPKSGTVKVRRLDINGTEKLETLAWQNGDLKLTGSGSTVLLLEWK